MRQKYQHQSRPLSVPQGYSRAHTLLQVAYNADRRRQLWEQTARDDLKELNDLRALVKAEEDRAEAKKKEAHARGAEVKNA